VAARVLIAGAGVAALEGALALRALADDRAELELLAEEHHFWYRPLSVAQPFGLGQATRYELPSLARAAGAVFTPGVLRGLDGRRRLALTSVGELPYDALLVAIGARPFAAVPGALTFRGPADTDELTALLAEIVTGDVRRVAFAAPARVTWLLPLYELALLTASHARTHGVGDLEVTVVTPETEPLALYGRRASVEVGRALELHGIELRTRVSPLEHRDGVLRLAPLGALDVERVVALPRLHGPALEGVPTTAGGFIPIDDQARVRGLEHVYAAGDAVDFPVKHGGIASLLADAAAASIAAELGAPVEARPFHPVLEGVLLGADGLQTLPPRPQAGREPPEKIAARYLAPFLARFPVDAASASSVRGQW
jgi:sulfide:quinone oxidoreductase